MNKKNKIIALVKIWPVKIAVLFLIAAILFLNSFYLFNHKEEHPQKPIPSDYNAKNLVKPTDIPEKPASLSAQLKIPIVMYHYVEYVQDKGDHTRLSLDTTPYTFESELKSLINEGYQTYFVKDIPKILEGKIKYDLSKAVVLTFDDGYEDFYLNAFPLIKEYHVKATLFPIYDFINKQGFLTDTEIREIIASGLVEIGSHTLDHVGLKHVSSQVAQKQIVDSKKDLEQEFGIKVESFAYPFGAFNNNVMEMVKQASYSAAVSVIPGSIQSENNLFYLSRIRAGFFSYNIAGVLSALKK